MSDLNIPSLPRLHCADGGAYYQGGSGATALLLIHGVGLCADCWRQQITALTAQYTVFAVDLPGHGESAGFAETYPTISDFTAKIADFIQNTIGAPVAVAGHSLGALIALELSAHAPQLVSRVAALSAVYNRSQAAQEAVRRRAALLQQADAAKDAAKRDALIDATVSRWFGNPPPRQWQAYAAQCRDWLRRTNSAAYAAAYHAFANHDAADTPLAQLAQPVLYLTGGDDVNSTAEMSRQMAAITPKAQAMVIDGHAHMLQMTAAAQVSDALAQWLAADSNTQTAA